ncbi:MAG: hemerythrin domain-containing protein [Bacteroidaceae bacterium]|nr:hemerythrin domain-containing protein [Bacteroidaceae bacterium]
MSDNTLYSDRMKMAELVAADGNLLSILQRLGIELGFGEATVADVCARYGLSKSLFLVICNIYSFRHYAPAMDSLDKNDIVHIINYLRVSHKYYKEVCFPGIHNKIHKLVEGLDDINRRLIDKFYDDYDNEVNNHFYFEENVVFPYIDSLFNAVFAGENEFSIVKFEENHSNIGEKLNDLKNILIKYLPEKYSSPMRFEILKEICAMENELRKHSLIENKLLVPLVQNLENSYE